MKKKLLNYERNIFMNKKSFSFYKIGRKSYNKKHKRC